MRRVSSCGASPKSRSSWQASSCSAFLTCRRPTARHPAGSQASSSDRKLISGKVAASRKPGPASSRSSTGDAVLTAPALAISRTVESSIGSVIRTLPDRGRRPRTGRPTTDAANEACDWAGSTRQLPAASRGCPPGGSCMPGVMVVAGHLPRWPGQPASSARHPGAASCRSRRHGWAPGPPCGLGLPHRGGGRAVGEGPDLLGDGAPVGGGGQLAEDGEQAEVYALQDYVGPRDGDVAGDRAAQVEEAAHDRGGIVAGDGQRPWFADGVVEDGQVLDDVLGAERRARTQESRGLQAAAERLGVVLHAYGADHLHERPQFGGGEVLDQAEVEEGDPAAAMEQVVARVRVAVKGAHLVQAAEDEAVDGLAGQVAFVLRPGGNFGEADAAGQLAG